MHVILDYNVGNLGSLTQSLKKAQMDVVVSKDKTVIAQATSLILPGVGAFKSAMDALHMSGLIPLILNHINQGKPLLGICLGMQLLYTSSDEYGRHKGLGLLPGTITRFKGDFTIPHMGWNALNFIQKDHPLLNYITPLDYVYFVHSYYAVDTEDTVIADVNYTVSVPAIVGKNNVYGMQFHPEKSGPVGARLLKAYKELVE